jgi:serine/threonine-protein kinase
MPGWCHGSAGYVFLWTQAYERLKDEEFLLLAEQAAWNAWEEPKGNIPNLCCGLAGRAYSLLNLYKLTGQQDWLRRAKRLASAATDLGKLPEYPAESLYKGDLGVALLMFDLERPETSAMPFFEREYT